MLTDTHTHLYLPEFDADRDILLHQAFEKNIHRFFLPNIDSSSIERMLALTKSFPEKMFPMIGLHPCSVKDNFEEELAIVEYWLQKDPGEGIRWAGVGEIGIDLYWDKTFLKEQEIVFKKQIKLASVQNLPIVIHSRNSFDEIYAVLLELRGKIPVRGIFHCFSGTPEQAEKIIEYGNFKLGIGGVVTFKNSGLDNVVRQIDLKHIVLETDAPFLAPVPHRGKRNEPAYLAEVAKKIAELKNITLEEVTTITSANAKEVFSKNFV